MGHFAAAWCFTSLLGLGVALLGAPHAASGQGRVVTDDSLGGDGVEVGPGTDPLGMDATYLITPELGEQNGSNLFHSFLYFDVGADETATFTGPDPVEGPQSVSNVISRVTGGDPSDIDGTLRSTIPGADLWLLNPSGVMFGQGVSLDVSGSFHASTGDYLGFGEDGLVRFYANEHPERPSVLSTARPEAFGFLEESTPGPIALEPGASLGTEIEGAVGPGQRLELVGGDVSLTDAAIVAPGAHVHLEAQGDVELTRSIVDVSGEAPGSVSIRGGRLVMQGGARRGEERSLVLAENRSTAELPPPGGRIEVEASESVLVDDSLLSVNTTSSGDAGTIHVASPNVTFQNGPGFFNLDNREIPQGEEGANVPHATVVGASAETGGSGRGGIIDIDAGELVVTEGASLSVRSFGPEVLEDPGDAGRIEIRADSMTVSRRADVSAAAWGSGGNGGTIDIDVTEKLRVDASDDDPDEGPAVYATIEASSSSPSWFFLNDAGSVPGAPGAIDIRAGHVEVTNGGWIESACWDCSSKSDDLDRPEGAGTVEIRADSMRLTGINSLGYEAAIGVSTKWDTGDAGRVVIELTGSLDVELGVIAADSLGEGLDRAGNAGKVEVRADSVHLEGFFRDGDVVVGSLIVARSVSPTGGEAGTIDLTARSLELIGGGGLAAGTYDGSSGNAGEIRVEADSVLISEPAHPDINTGIFVPSLYGASGDAGTIALSVRTLAIEAGGQIGAASAHPLEAIQNEPRGGNPGTIRVRASESISVSNEGGEVFSLGRALLGGLLPGFDPLAVTGVLAPSVYGAAEAEQVSSITLEAPEITISHGALVGSSTVGGGDAGSVVLKGENIRIVEGGNVNSVTVPILGRIPGGKGGDVLLLATESIQVAGFDPADEARENRSAVGSSTLVAPGSGPAGTVTLRAPRIVVEDGGIVQSAAARYRQTEHYPAPGGQITLDAAEAVIVRNGGLVDATTFVRDRAGDIVVTAGDSIVVEGQGTRIESRTGGTGPGGNVSLEAPQIEIRNDGVVSARSAPGYQGVGFTLLEDDGLLANEPMTARGNAGAVHLAARELSLVDGGTVATDSVAADGGDITIEAKDLVHLDTGEITAAVAAGDGGNIWIGTDPMG
jgi:filamentous hemagglutinin family protein